jgi:hypothetical protein
VNKEQKRIATATHSLSYWDDELSSRSGIDDRMAVAYRWLRALRKVKRTWGSSGRFLAEAHLNFIEGQMVAWAREISRIDRLDGAAQHAAWEAYRQRERERAEIERRRK